MLPRDSSKEFVETLASLARTHDIFGTGVTAPLRTVIDGELTGFGNQVELDGCDILLTARAAQDFTLIVHELATNALKYGALSTTNGRVTISGHESAPGMFVFTWEERDGPSVALPGRKGFGQTILNDLARSFCIDVKLAYDPQGLRYELIIPVDRVADVTFAGVADSD
jgi:two-component sensor histidine kinase